MEFGIKRDVSGAHDRLVRFTCPNTGIPVQDWFTEPPADNENGVAYTAIKCVACLQMHLLNAKTGQILGDET